MLASKVKKAIRRTPILGDVLLAMRHRAKNRFTYSRLPLLDMAGLQREVAQARNVLAYTKTSGQSYSAVAHPAGYHTIEVAGEVIEGQRKPHHRLAMAPIDWTGKTVLDIGSNQGGMLHALDGKLKWGVGLDFNPKLVNAATRIADIRGDDTLRFYTFDLEQDPLDLIEDFLPDSSVDVVLLLSVCMWIKNWREVLEKASHISNNMLFESNGSDEQQEAQERELNRHFSSVELLAGSSEDDLTQKRRKLFWCS